MKTVSVWDAKITVTTNSDYVQIWREKYLSAHAIARNLIA
jgi:hypothetical protein